MSRERGQALVEAVAAVPVCMACALLLVDAGVLIRDRIAVTQAATRAAEAQLIGRDPIRAARGALPGSIRPSARVVRRGDRIVVTVTSGARIARLVGSPGVHRSSVEVTA